jgi:hypothetical protein
MCNDYCTNEFIGIAPPSDETWDISQQDLEGMPYIGGSLIGRARVQQSEWVGVQPSIAGLARRFGEGDLETAGVEAEAKVQSLQRAFFATPEQSDGEVSQVGRCMGYECLFVCTEVIRTESRMAGFDQFEVTADTSCEWGDGANCLSGAVTQGNGEVGRFVSEKDFGRAGAIGPYLDL